MRRLRIRVRRLVPLAFLLLPPTLWALVLTIAPTEWARTRIVAKLNKKSGRTIHLGQLNIGVLGGIRLSDLEIGSPHSSSDPWLKARSVKINVSVWQLLCGQVEPSRIAVDGLTLRVLRRKDGSLELADLLHREGSASSDEEKEPCEPQALELTLSGGHVSIIDEPSRSHVELANVEGHAISQGHVSTLHELRGTLNDGPFSLSASVDRSSAEPRFEGRFHGRSMALIGMSSALTYVIPVLSGLPDPQSIDGKMRLDVYLRGQGKTRVALRRSLIGQGALVLDSITLTGSRFLAELSDILDLAGGEAAGTVHSDFLVKQGRVGTENLTVDVGRIPIAFAGWTDFDGALDYRLRTDNVTQRLPSQAREYLSGFSIDLKSVSSFHVTGTLDAMDLTLDGKPLGLTAKDGKAGSDRQRLRELGRKFRDQIIR